MDRQEKREQRSRDVRREPRGARLDVPTDTRRAIVRRPAVDSDTFGRFAETFARFMGTARFLFYMSLFVVIWVLVNVLAPASNRSAPSAASAPRGRRGDRRATAGAVTG